MIDYDGFVRINCSANSLSHLTSQPLNNPPPRRMDLLILRNEMPESLIQDEFSDMRYLV
jgi:hypothetical protein